MNTKQVIVMRKFPNLRTGKYISQACHASMSFLTKEGDIDYELYESWGNITRIYSFTNTSYEIISNREEINHWLKNSFRKIVCCVNSEEELKELHEKALDSGLMSHMIEDNGATEFNGVKTLTALAIGPHEDSKFIGITDHLPLL